MISQSEEHLVVKTPEAATLRVGDVLYGTPWHVCPTVALYNEALVIENGTNTGAWAIARGGYFDYHFNQNISMQSVIFDAHWT